MGFGAVLVLVAGGFLAVSGFSRTALSGAWSWFGGATSESLPEAWENSLGMRFRPLPGESARMSIWETRIGDFETFVRDTGYEASHGAWMYITNLWIQNVYCWSNTGHKVTAKHPVASVSWQDAMAFCSWLTDQDRAAGSISPRQFYRLPTESEWNLAAGLSSKPSFRKLDRENRKRLRFGNYYWVAGVIGDPHEFTAPVGSFKANELGFYDLAGNVWEYCMDTSPGRTRVIRGGSWLNFSDHYSRATARAFARETVRSVIYGFRVVLDEAPDHGLAAVEAAASPGG